MIKEISIPDLIQLASESYGRMLAARVEGDIRLERLCQCNMAAAEVMLNGQLINGRKGPKRAPRKGK